MSPPLVARAELMSIEISASVVVDHDASRRRAGRPCASTRFDLALDLEAREQRHAVVVELELAQVVRHDALHELLRLVVDFRLVDQDLADVVGAGSRAGRG